MCDIEHVLEKFERAWQSSNPPLLEEFASAARSDVQERSWLETLAELVKIDLEYRWRSGSSRHIAANDSLRDH